MKISRSVKKYLARLGIKPLPLNQSHPFNIQNVIVFFVFGLCITLNSAYFFLEATRFVESIESLYLTCLAIVCTINFASLIWKMSKLFDLINNLEKIVEESK